jgi:hypothetical protein
MRHYLNNIAKNIFLGKLNFLVVLKDDEVPWEDFIKIMKNSQKI